MSLPPSNAFVVGTTPSIQPDGDDAAAIPPTDDATNPIQHLQSTDTHTREKMRMHMQQTIQPSSQDVNMAICEPASSNGQPIHGGGNSNYSSSVFRAEGEQRQLRQPTIIDLTQAMRRTNISEGGGEEPKPEHAPEIPTANPYSEKHPHPSLAPEDVIEIQLGAMKYNELPVANAGIEICFRFASPANRMYTGPVSRFIRMIHNPLYECMINYDAIRFVPANVAGTKWRLYITKNGLTKIFLWSLSKQVLAPYTDCWMTDNVLLVQE